MILVTLEITIGEYSHRQFILSKSNHKNDIAEAIQRDCWPNGKEVEDEVWWWDNGGIIANVENQQAILPETIKVLENLGVL